MSNLPTPAISQIAARLFAQRQAEARRVIRTGGMLPAQAEAHLAPWAAIALHARADLSHLLPGLAEAVADYVCTYADGTPRISEREAQCLVALNLCPVARWRALLAKAAAAAVSKAESFGQPTPRWSAPTVAERDAALARARDLLALAAELRVLVPITLSPANPALPETTKPVGMAA